MNQISQLNELLSDWIWEINPTGIFTQSSTNLTKILGLLPEEIIGKSFFDVLPPAESERVRDILSPMIESKSPFASLEIMMQHKNNEIVVFEISAHPHYNTQGEFLGFQGIAKDITTLKHLESIISQDQIQLLTLASTLPFPLLILDAEGTITHLNPSASQLWINHELQLLNKPLNHLLFLDPNLVDLTNDLLSHAVQGLAFHHSQIRILPRAHSKSAITGALHLIPATTPTDDNPNPETLIAIIPPTTELSGEAEKLNFSRFANLLPDALITINSQGAVSLWNDSAERLFFIKRDEAINQPIHELILPSNQSTEIANLRRILCDSRMQATYPLKAKNKNGGKLFLEITLNRFQLEQQPTILLLIRTCSEAHIELLKESEKKTTLPPSTQELETDERIAKLTREIEQTYEEKEKIQLTLHQASKMASIGSLAAGVVHEIHNPLSIIQSYIGVLRDQITQKKDIQSQLTVLSKQEDATHRISKILESLKSFSRPDSQQMETTNVHKLLTDTLSLLEEAYHRLGIQLETRLQSSRPHIKAHIGKLQQALMNLISNAKDALENQAHSGLILIETTDNPENKDEITIRVSDNGCGIPSDIKQKIFDPFFTTKPIGKSTGLGLSATLSIIQSMGGTLQVDSEVGIGSTFTIQLPKAEIPLTEIKASDFRQYGAKQRAPLQGKVLIVDDEEDIRLIISEFLSTLGMNTLEAKDGEEALEILHKHSFDFVITDLRMPRRNGESLIIEAKKLNLPYTRFIVITGGIVSSYTQEQREFIRTNAQGYLRKPFSPDELYLILKSLQNER